MFGGILEAPWKRQCTLQITLLFTGQSCPNSGDKRVFTATHNNLPQASEVAKTGWQAFQPAVAQIQVMELDQAANTIRQALGLVIVQIKDPRLTRLPKLVGRLFSLQWLRFRIWR